MRLSAFSAVISILLTAAVLISAFGEKRVLDSISRELLIITTVVKDRRHEAATLNQRQPTSETSILITANLIPTHPSIHMINQTLLSVFQHAKGLGTIQDVPIIMGMDGLKEDASEDDARRFKEYLHNFQQAFPRAKIVAQNKSNGISWNVYHALQQVTTKYLYCIQHDMPFIADINHSAIVKTMEQYPTVLRIVRFNLRANMPKRSNRGGCWGENGPIYPNINGVSFTKTPGWSDNNHFTTVDYYHDIFANIITSQYRYQPMEFRMHGHARRVNCTLWGPYLYGAIGDGPFISHLDGRNTKAAETPAATE